MIRRIRIKNVFTGYSEHARLFSLSYFLSTHYNMTIPDLVFFCKSTCLFSGSIASIFFLIERTVPVFLSNHFFISNSCGIRVNNVTQEQMSGNYFNFLAIGDIIEFDLVNNCTYTSIFAPLFVILFNIMLTCRSLFFRKRLLYVILSKLIQYIFKSKRILKALSKKHIPVVRSALLGTRAGVSYNSVSYFIRSRATSHTHMIYALSLGKRLGVRDISKRGLFAFFPFVQTVVSTNKAFVTEFLEFDGMNGF